MCMHQKHFFALSRPVYLARLYFMSSFCVFLIRVKKYVAEPCRARRGWWGIILGYYIHISTYMYTYIYIYICIGRERERKRESTKNTDSSFQMSSADDNDTVDGNEGGSEPTTLAASLSNNASNDLSQSGCLAPVDVLLWMRRNVWKSFTIHSPCTPKCSPA